MQQAVPLVPRPFAALGQEVGLSEEEVLARVAGLKQAGILRQVSAIFNAADLGFVSTLVAMKINPTRLDEAGKIISRHPGVSHNYARESEYNLWFTLTLPQEDDIEATVKEMASQVEAAGYLVLPSLRRFKIAVMLDLVSPVEATHQAGGYPSQSVSQGKDRGWDPRLIRSLEEDLPLVPRPFEELAKKVGLTEEELLAGARELKEKEVMRRYAGVLNHRRVGFLANAMTVWRVPEERIEEVGQLMASFDAVSHCYQRPTYPDWPYNLYAMIHGRSQKDCTKVVSALAEATLISDYRMLYSTKEYKKVRVKYSQPGEGDKGCKLWNNSG